ncbi:MAG: septum formation initiator family protein [Pseudomonadota bacterium]
MIRSQTWDFLFVTLLLAGLAYLAVDAYFGARGFDEKTDLQARKAALESELKALEAQRAMLLRRTDALKGPEIDLDLLDEQLRAKLGVGRADEQLLIPDERLSP